MGAIAQLEIVALCIIGARSKFTDGLGENHLSHNLARDPHVYISKHVEYCRKGALQCPRSSQIQDQKLGPTRPELFLRSSIPIPTIFTLRWKRSISPLGWRQGERSRSRSLEIFSSAKYPTPA